MNASWARRLQLQKARWDVLREAGVAANVGRGARSSAVRFAAALASVGVDASAWPNLLNTNKGARGVYATSKVAVETRVRRAALKAAGLDSKRCGYWARSDGAVAYALRQIRIGRIDYIPLTPGMLGKSA